MLYSLVSTNLQSASAQVSAAKSAQTNDVRAAFDKAYESEADSIFRYCLTRVSDYEQALDITQETFVRLWSSLIAGKLMYNSRAYLFTIAHNLVIDWYRAKKAVSLESMANEDSGEAFDPPDEKTLSENLEMGSEGRFLLQKINELGPSFIEPVYLRFVEGLSPSEIGKIVGISDNAVSVRIYRGIRKLRQLTGYEIPEGSV